MKHYFTKLYQGISHHIMDALDFQSRIWVIRITESTFKDQSFIINEDSFSESLQWMKQRNYSVEMLEQVEKMAISQVNSFQFGDQHHQLMRVK
ncbi:MULTISPECIES: hypothetical protein [Vibrio]|uniref:Uncharacterized protein n=3 Tax=Vibrio TaxID=662 RepID=A0A1E5CY91_9VIBR|nr:hypothetical protein [Vibrio genomosp. F6]OEE75265.1 hypothetical protein A130_17170 [Vibrio genomosp. F6 str. FF-238]